jgi:ABC-2 type transport system permease protein
MSTSELTTASDPAELPPGPAPRTVVGAVPMGGGGSILGLRLVRSELRLVFRRRRNQVLLAVLACAPILLGIAVRASAPTNDSAGPAFLGQITDNGLFLAFTSLVVTLPLFLPLAVAVVAGESIAGEASTGSLRNLLVVPVSRTRLLLVKYVGIAAFAVSAALTVFLVGSVVGWALFKHGAVTLLSGDVVSSSDALWRALLVAGYVAAMLLGVGAIGLFASTLTEVPMGAMAGTAVLTIAAEIADSVPQISWIHPYLYTHYWLSFGDLLRQPIQLHEIWIGLGSQVAYVVIFGSLAWARLTTKDITS